MKQPKWRIRRTCFNPTGWHLDEYRDGWLNRSFHKSAYDALAELDDRLGRKDDRTIMFDEKGNECGQD